MGDDALFDKRSQEMQKKMVSLAAADTLFSVLNLMQFALHQRRWPYKLQIMHAQLCVSSAVSSTAIGS